jgi:teichuronic acid biosynthesis glycosyltransferase TuaC
VSNDLRVLVYSSVFPHAGAPNAGLFIRERMFRAARAGVALRVLAPQTWSPLDPIGRALRSQFRTMGALHEVDAGIEVDRPKALSIPGVMKTLDGSLMAHSVRRTFDRIVGSFRPTLLDAHFLYPAGYSARLLARRHDLPYTVTIRGSADEWLIGTSRESMLVDTLRDAAHVICVSQALQRNVVHRLIGDATPSTVIGNGVDLEKFYVVDRSVARQQLGIADDAQVIVGVGGLVARKGFQRIIPLLPELRRRFPRLLFLIVGGGATVQDMRATLEAQVRELGLADAVRFCGFQPPEALKTYYSAADVFALATEHEGWANVFLEAMACGLPVVTTRVGGNAEVVVDDTLGKLVDFFDAPAFAAALADALERRWDRAAICAYARANTWDARIAALLEVFRSVASGSGKP